ncbi:helix-turn-helix transcriptional regulator [Aeromicrobium sp. Marseille-Q0843]|uniref:Helix-turn-helix transcriptional regulator n=1 Tax=Aeromicrobium phoceense TaxID=2754045 RepID=A0A838XKE0_9ACTN|nr:helix-turn-helix transcriptional regulator [Aeromicrobium phoceense]
MDSPRPTDPADGDGELNQEFLVLVGRRIREARNELRLTMQQLADQSGISRRLLTQIEHGQANPSLVAITRIARQLGTDFTTLLAPDDSAAALESVSAADHVLVWSTSGGSSAHLLVASSGSRTADLWSWTLQPGDSYIGRADPDGSQELFHVLEGELTIGVDGDRHALAAGTSCRLLSDRPYEYANDSSEPTRFIRTVVLAARA